MLIREKHPDIYSRGVEIVSRYLGDMAYEHYFNGESDKIDSLVHYKMELWSQLSNAAESPLELMLAPYLTIMTDGFSPVSYEFAPRDRWCGTAIEPQYKIGKWRVDFILILNVPPQRKYIVVECDGHEYHERTKQQAARDRSKDRWLQERGIPILRYTGHEIHKDPEACALQVENLAFNIMEEMLIAGGFLSAKADG